MRADPPCDWLWPSDTVLRAQVAVGLHDVDLARQQYERLQPYSRTLAIALGIVVLGPIDQVLGELAASFGGDATAGEHFRRAIDTSTQVGAPVWEARARASLDQLASR